MQKYSLRVIAARAFSHSLGRLRPIAQSRRFRTFATRQANRWVRLRPEVPPNGAWSQNRLFDHLVCEGEQRRRDLKADRLRRLQVDREMKSRRLLDRDIGRLGALQDLIDDRRGGPVRPNNVRALG
jgi:hypothetical protein